MSLRYSGSCSSARVVALVCSALLFASCGYFGKRETEQRVAIGATTAAEAAEEEWQCQPSADRAWQCFNAESLPPPAPEPTLATTQENIEPLQASPETVPASTSIQPDLSAPSSAQNPEVLETSATIAAVDPPPDPSDPMPATPDTAVDAAGTISEPIDVDSVPATPDTAVEAAGTISAPIDVDPVPTAPDTAVDTADTISQPDGVEPTPQVAVARPASTLPPPPVEPPDDISSLLAYPNWVYVVQIVAARSQRTINRLAETYRDSGRQLFQISDPDSHLKLLLIGVFHDRDAAQRAIDSLEPPLESSPWVRRLGPLQDALERSAEPD